MPAKAISLQANAGISYLNISVLFIVVDLRSSLLEITHYAICDTCRNYTSFGGDCDLALILSKPQPPQNILNFSPIYIVNETTHNYYEYQNPQWHQRDHLESSAGICPRSSVRISYNIKS